MPFTHLKLHPDLLRGVKDLGFQKPTPIQADAIPPALAGRDLLACAQTGSGKTAAFLLPILHGLMQKPRTRPGTTRALIITPTRELAAQIVEDLRDFTVHTPISGFAVYGGVGMGPQEHAFRSGVDVIVGTPGRLLDHFRQPYAKLGGLEYLVLDEADRMLDMGFLPDIRRVLRHIPSKRQTLFFSATMPEPIVKLSQEMLQNPVMINLERKPLPATGIAHAVYPVPSHLKQGLLLSLLNKGDVKEALVFTRTKHRADRLAKHLEQNKVSVQRIHGNRSQSQRTEALAGFKSGKYRVLVATDIAARGIDVTALGHVINFDVPAQPEDYIHRVGRTARAELTGSAFTLVAPEDEGSVREIERAINKRLPRVTVPDFDYTARAEQRLEMPHAQRIAEIRARKADERQRARANVERRAKQGHAQPGHGQGQGQRQGQGQGQRQGQGQGPRPAGPRPGGQGPRPHGPGPRRFRPRGRPM
jgi:ATP-dependent RNA helicase RhlE